MVLCVIAITDRVLRYEAAKASGHFCAASNQESVDE
jgi:hypothetical protein